MEKSDDKKRKLAHIMAMKYFDCEKCNLNNVCCYYNPELFQINEEQYDKDEYGVNDSDWCSADLRLYEDGFYDALNLDSNLLQ